MCKLLILRIVTWSYNCLLLLWLFIIISHYHHPFIACLKYMEPYKCLQIISIYYNKFKTFDLVIKNNSSPSIGVLQKNNIIYQFKCHLGDCISENNNIYVGLTSTTLSRRLTMHLSDTSSITQHFFKNSCPTTELRNILTENTTILEDQNDKQKLQILDVLHIRNIQPKLNRINFKTRANVLKCF